MNTYIKYCPNVYVMQTEETFSNGDEAIITTKYGAEHVVTVWNLVGKTKDGKNCYSITRNDGFNFQEWARRRAERLEEWAAAADRKEEQAYGSGRTV